MATIKFEIKDEHIVEICKGMGFSYEIEPSIKEHTKWLTERLQGYIPYELVIEKDYEFITKKSELSSLFEQKLTEAKNETKK